jgi:hypothetical protein
MLETQKRTSTQEQPSVVSDRIVHGKKNLQQIEKVYHQNKNSNYTERMEELKQNFNYGDNSEDYWLDPEFSLLYGSPIYEAASESQKKALNHLYWVCFYNYTIGGEISTMMFNQLTCGAFYHLGGYEILCHEIDIETSQERVHVEAFREISRKTELALLGETIFERRLVGYMDAALVHPQSGERPVIQQFPPMLASLSIVKSPFIASQYYVARGLRNIQVKVKEYQHYLYSRERTKQGKKVCDPTLVSYYHCLDEGFHTTTSKFISHDLYKDFPKANPWEIFASNILVSEVQKTMNKLSSTVPGIFSDDTVYIPLVYRLLQTPLFSMSASEALEMLEKNFCQEHEGYHIAAKYHKRALTQNLEYVEGLDHLTSANRQLRVMASASIEQTLKNNMSAFRHFSKSLSC